MQSRRVNGARDVTLLPVDAATFYDRLGVGPQVDPAQLRAAYHQRARELHPDVAPSDGPEAQLRMALVNEAWAVLSDPDQRHAYDRALAALAAAARRPSGTSTASGPTRPAAVVRPVRPEQAGARRVRPTVGRKDAWLDSIRLQVRRLGNQAGRSAAQSLLLRHHGVARCAYEDEIAPIVAHLLTDTEARVRQARAAGAVPLDLANGAALLGLWSLAAELLAQQPPDASTVRRAEMVDRMFDTMAHELPRGLVRALGDNPRVARRLGARRS